MKKIKPNIIRIIYIIVIIISFLILAFSLTFPWAWYTTSSSFPGGRSTSWLGIHGFAALFPGGYIGIICMVISIGYVSGGNAKKAIITNIIGILSFAITFILWSSVAPMLVPPDGKYGGVAGGYFIGLASFAVYCLAFLFLVENRSSMKIEKVVVTETKKVLENIEKEDKKYCPSCGTEIIDKTSTFCNKCGSPLKPQ